ncbi:MULTISPECIES: ECF transporter S component [Lactiplantibacillus]|uniref:ECF transporter S component n=3 Tax=Lactiplantibacillus pentosus TaxID=1589 RepID=A0AAX6LGH4_LACPE|nr:MULTISPECIES: ECF transporter S component [Lactiplantibacillus]KRK23510.1 integral membrane protein [Lactiplantibacillus pentosus DSM 20314]CCB82306.1 integral membrane protein [Lactiplantibacillus pentosus MP-10]AYJ42773.1 ECF transporter S component [Lactiplantibacillus pentosus]MBU7448672.1 ECF transporter S component [Lactiplantibacillus sp. 7.2.4]MBU7481307.1 ECF transporter S component [Lactiplantibacillus pentosus]
MSHLVETKFNTRTVATLGMLIALNVVISIFFHIPIPMTHGYINLCDAGIFIAALIFGRRGGVIVGGASGLLLDLLLGYPQYMFFSLIAHGLEGWLAGYLGAGKSRGHQIAALATGAVVMVLGYFITDSLLYTLATGLVGVPTNLIQGAAGAVLAFPIVAGISPFVKARLKM